jgi:NifB/MoaA-like Fe-S oxidoreductase
VGHRLAFVADEYYLLAERPFPGADTYEGFPMHEDGIGMARAFELEFTGRASDSIAARPGFFQWVDGAPAEGYRAVRVELTPRRARTGRTGILTGTYGARVLAPLLAGLGRDDIRTVPVDNRFFGGNIGVTGLLVGEDLARVLRDEPEGDRYLLPDVCLTQGRFLDGMAPDDLPRRVEIVATDGAALRAALA